jgi:hypothetical protein
MSQLMLQMRCKTAIGGMPWMKNLMLFGGITPGGWLPLTLVKMPLIAAGFIKSNASPMDLLIDIRPDW